MEVFVQLTTVLLKSLRQLCNVPSLVQITGIKISQIQNLLGYVPQALAKERHDYVAVLLAFPRLYKLSYVGFVC